MNVAEENQAQLEKRQAIQAIMRDTGLTPQEKQKKIQQLMATGGQSASTGSAPASTPPVAATPAPHPQIQPARADPPVPQPTPGAGYPASPSRVGAMQSTGTDPGARKGARTSTGISSTAVATITREGSEAEIQSGNATYHDSASMMSSEPDAMSIPTLGAVASSGVDPAARKAGRNPTRNSSRVSTTGSLASSESQSVGASSAAVQEDPAMRKAPRTSRTLASSTAVSSDMSMSIQPMSTIEEPGTEVAVASSYYASTSRDQSYDFGNVESVPDYKPASTLLPAPVPESLPASSSYSTPAVGTTPVIHPPPEPQDQYTVYDNQQSAPQPETYATGSTGVMSPAIDGDTVEIQAYVAGGTREVVVGATNVITEDEIAEEEEKKQMRLLRLGGLICCLLLIVIIVPIAIVVPDDPVVMVVSESPSSAPSSAPTSALFADLLDALQPLYPDEESYQAAFANSSTPQYQAAEWAASNAPADLTASDPRMISRYALATFYYATNGADWVRCGVGSTNCDAGREWLTAENECDWLAVGCVDPSGGDHTVLELYFRQLDPDGNNVGGTLPFELALLTSLNRIVLSRQALRGSIPETWSSRLPNLETFIIGINQLTGTFPDFLFLENSLLGTLFLHTNKLSGSLPPISSSALRALRIDENLFTGSVPSEYGTLQGLQELNANNNKLTGPLPEELYNLGDLRILDLGNNTGLTGTISESIANLKNLTLLRIGKTSMGGPLPFGLFDLIDLQILDLASNSFSGSLPSDFARLSNITQIELNNNAFAGAVPDGLDSLTLLRKLTLQANSLTGTVSSNLCARIGTSFLDLNTLTADCSGSPPEVTCDCCTECF